MASKVVLHGITSRLKFSIVCNVSGHSVHGSLNATEGCLSHHALGMHGTYGTCIRSADGLEMTIHAERSAPSVCRCP